MPNSRRQKCKGCGECFSKRLKLLRVDDHDLRHLKPSLKSRIKEGDMICHKCLGAKVDPLPDTILKERGANIPVMPSTTTASSEAIDEGPFEKKIKLDIPRSNSSSRKCIICSAYRELDSNISFKSLQPNHRAKFFVKTGIIVNRGTRVCSNHFEGDTLSKKSYQKITASSNSFNATSEDIKELLNEVRNNALHGSHTLDFDDSTAMNDEDYMRLTGIKSYSLTKCLLIFPHYVLLLLEAVVQHLHFCSLNSKCLTVDKYSINN